MRPKDLPTCPDVPANPYITLFDLFWEACGQATEEECLTVLDQCYDELAANIVRAEEAFGISVAELDKPVTLAEVPVELRMGLSEEAVILKPEDEVVALSEEESLESDGEGRQHSGRVQKLLTAHGFGIGASAELKFGDAKRKRRRKETEPSERLTSKYDPEKEREALVPFEKDFVEAIGQIGADGFPMPYQLEELYVASKIRDKHTKPASVGHPLYSPDLESGSNTSPAREKTNRVRVQ